MGWRWTQQAQHRRRSTSRAAAPSCRCHGCCWGVWHPRRDAARRLAAGRRTTRRRRRRARVHLPTAAAVREPTVQVHGGRCQWGWFQAVAQRRRRGAGVKSGGQCTVQRWSDGRASCATRRTHRHRDSVCMLRLGRGLQAQRRRRLALGHMSPERGYPCPRPVLPPGCCWTKALPSVLSVQRACRNRLLKAGGVGRPTGARLRALGSLRAARVHLGSCQRRMSAPRGAAPAGRAAGRRRRCSQLRQELPSLPRTLVALLARKRAAPWRLLAAGPPVLQAAPLLQEGGVRTHGVHG